MSYHVNKDSKIADFPEFTVDADDVCFDVPDFIYFRKKNDEPGGYDLVYAIRRTSVVTVERVED